MSSTSPTNTPKGGGIDKCLRKWLMDNKRLGEIEIYLFYHRKIMLTIQGSIFLDKYHSFLNSKKPLRDLLTIEKRFSRGKANSIPYDQKAISRIAPSML